MTPPTAQQRRPPSGAGLLLLFVVVSGVFGMHALDTHGVAGNHTVGMTAHSSTPAPSMGDGSLRTSSAGHVHSSPEVPMPSASSSGPAPAGDFSSVLSLCLGVLAASLLLLLVRRGRGLAVVDLVPRWLSVAQQSTTRGRDRDPPSLALLSVRRC